MSTFEEFLVTRGEGVHSIFATVMDAGNFADLRKWLASEGVTVAQSYRLGAADFYYFDMRKLLGAFYIQVVVPLQDDWERTIPVDETWDFSKELTRPRDLKGATDALGITHFGIVVDNLSEKLPNFAKLFGQPVWRGMHWRTAPGSLEDTTNNGVPVVHGYFTGRSDLGKNVSGLPWGFEVIQPTAGPSHYKEDYLQLLGPGIHHVDVRIPLADWDEWERINRWLGDDFGAPTCMSGWLRNHSALFHYQDTRKRLGYVTEISRAAQGRRGKRLAAGLLVRFLRSGDLIERARRRDRDRGRLRDRPGRLHPLAGDGWSIVTVDRNAERNAETARAIGERGGHATAVDGNVADAAVAEAACRQAERDGTLRALVNAAAMRHSGSIVEITAAQWDETLGYVFERDVRLRESGDPADGGRRGRLDRELLVALALVHPG